MEESTTVLTRRTLRPKYFHTFRWGSNQLHRVNLSTGELSYQTVTAYQFKEACRLTELPGGSLLITGGGLGVVEVVRIDTLREWAVTDQPPMHTGTISHATVYHSQYLYVLGGYNDRHLSECERYACAESRWEELPPLPVACGDMSAVVLENSLYALGGNTSTGDSDTILILSLDSLTWQLMQLNLPQPVCGAPCFMANTQVYLMIKETLCSFTPQEVKPIKTLPNDIFCSSSDYSSGTLYYDYWGDGVGSFALGKLTSP
jgi:hypothetical protein